MIMNNLRLKTKLALVTFSIVSLMLASLIIYYLGMKRESAIFNDFKNVRVALALSLSEIYGYGLQTEQATRNIVLNPADEIAPKNFEKALKDFDNSYRRAIELGKNEPIFKELEAARPNWDKALALKKNIINLAKAGKQGEAAEIINKEETQAWREFKLTILKIRENVIKDFNGSSEKIDEVRKSTFNACLVLFIITAAFCMVSLLLFSIDLRNKLFNFISSLKEMADGEGDLTMRIKMQGKDEFSEMALIFNRAWERLDQMVSQIVEQSTLVGTFSGQLTIEAQKIARGAHKIASDSSMVATASEEMAATSNDISKNCSMAANDSGRANGLATDGHTVVQKTINRMNSIKNEIENSSGVIEKLGQSSEKIGEIADTIQDIADQTNLLALNAAIEAARAGEQGRGFAVVADEVRALAERTSRATREIADMTKSIQSETDLAVKAMRRSASEVEAGVLEANDSGESLTNIINQIGEVTLQVSQIATAAEEQTATTTEIVSNISNISDSVARFDRSAVTINEKIRSLQSLSDDLKKATSVFKSEIGPYLILDIAKSDHVQFVNRIERCVDGKEEIASSALPDHHSCRFGKWYFSDGSKLCADSYSFKAIDDPHERIHRIAKEVVDLRNRGEIEQAERKLEEVEQISSEIVELLEKVKIESRKS
ncbi:MAG: methyl-accepting chemotaxis protein [Desulfuromonadaceae bacterium]|nr:methyl-accepting chemotaxis protein [Desulfuromonadaceae bacterium]